jgi:hypothetical protein
MVLPADPETLDLPDNPQIPAAIQTWQKVVQPTSLGLTGLAVLTTGLAAFFARRNHHQELERMRQQSTAKAAARPTSETKENDR